MKLYSVLLILILGINFSCMSDDFFSYQNDFQNSKEAWLSFKANSNNSYKYVVSGGTGMSNLSWETTITVQEGEIVQRHFIYEGDIEGLPEDELEWTENEGEINTHESYVAAPAITMDEVYQKAENEWLVESSNVTTYFQVDYRGLLSTCGYVRNGCADDCFVGIHIKSIVAL